MPNQSSGGLEIALLGFLRGSFNGDFKASVQKLCRHMEPEGSIKLRVSGAGLQKNQIGEHVRIALVSDATLSKMP